MPARQVPDRSAPFTCCQGTSSDVCLETDNVDLNWRSRSQRIEHQIFRAAVERWLRSRSSTKRPFCQKDSLDRGSRTAVSLRNRPVLSKVILIVSQSLSFAVKILLRQHRCSFDLDHTASLPQSDKRPHGSGEMRMPIHCSNCGEHIVAPVVSRLISQDEIQHVWHCSGCFAVFHSAICLKMRARGTPEVCHECHMDHMPSNGKAHFHRYHNQHDLLRELARGAHSCSVSSMRFKPYVVSVKCLG